ncbi:acyl carrier protein [Micromonospora sp. BRA006-A]|nr:acyl carrier protein [Micromonospora sp. BRA006-A]
MLGHGSRRWPRAGRSARSASTRWPAVELRNRLTTATGLRLPATLIFDYPDRTSWPRTWCPSWRLDTGPVAAGPRGPGEPGRSLTEATVEPELHDQIGSRLEVLIAKWRTMRAGTGGDPDLDLELASDDDLFDLIDSELGI